MIQRERQISPIGFGLVLLLGLLWGIPFALTKISLATIPPATLVAARVTIAAMALWLVVLVKRRSIPRQLSFAKQAVIQGSLACVIPYTLIAYGQLSVDSGLSAILNSTAPLMVCVISAMWTHHEPVTVSRICGVILGLVGVVIVTGAATLSGFGREFAGQSAILLATSSSAVSVIYGRRFSTVTPEVVAASALTSAAAMLLPICIALDWPLHAAPSTASIVALAVNAVVATALGFVVYFRLIGSIGSMATASAGYLKPAVAVVLGVSLLGESLSRTMVAGLLAILVGVAVINGLRPIAAFRGLKVVSLQSLKRRLRPLLDRADWSVR